MIHGRKEENDWRAEDDMHTLVAAQKIKADSKRYKAAMAKIKEKAEMLNKMADKKAS